MTTTKNPLSLKIDNPIKELLFELGTSSQNITLDYLHKVNKLLVKYGIKSQTYGNVFNFLEYLEETGCVKITKHTDGDYYTITGLYNYGENV
jgi:aldehyde:ferredoxin oxidoreductase